jgi:tRNA(Ser,Leu) C12 N-acetylase TAN1
MKQTAVEWLENKFKEELVLINSVDGYHIFIRVEKFDELLNKAKEMEKEQSQKYAEFAIECDRAGLPILDFEGFKNL